MKKLLQDDARRMMTQVALKAVMNSFERGELLHIIYFNILNILISLLSLLIRHVDHVGFRSKKKDEESES